MNLATFKNPRCEAIRKISPHLRQLSRLACLQAGVPEPTGPLPMHLPQAKVVVSKVLSVSIRGFS